MVGIVHLDVAVRGITTVAIVFEITGVTAFQDVDFGVIDFGVYMVIHSPVFGAEVFGARWVSD
jgi:hypothetical protein